jgi:hypothetical protein
MHETDFVCDFCGQHWSTSRPMVEGHKGSLICGHCLSLACAQVLVHNAGIVVPEHIACTMCLMNKRGDYYRSPVLVEVQESTIAAHDQPGSAICRWCIERSASMLEKDLDSGWKRPA